LTRTRKYKPRFSFDVFEGWSTDNDGNQHHTKTVLCNSLEQMDNYLHLNYDLTDSQDLSDDTQLVYERTGAYTVSDHGNLVDIEVTDDKLDDSGELKEPYFYQTEYVSATKEKLTKANYEFYKSGKHWTSVIDLTED